MLSNDHQSSTNLPDDLLEKINDPNVTIKIISNCYNVPGGVELFFETQYKKRHFLLKTDRNILDDLIVKFYDLLSYFDKLILTNDEIPAFISCFVLIELQKILLKEESIKVAKSFPIKEKTFQLAIKFSNELRETLTDYDINLIKNFSKISCEYNINIVSMLQNYTSFPFDYSNDNIITFEKVTCTPLDFSP